MKNNLFPFLCSFTLCLHLNANNFNKAPANKPGVFFTENKGQVADQNNVPRPDVLFLGTDGELTFQIKTTGISYQLYRLDAGVENQQMETNDRILATQIQTVYRVDVNWIGINKAFGTVTDGTQGGYDNYYSAACPTGAARVKRFKHLTLKNLYNHIDLHYYEKGGHLKYDFIVSPKADYKKIQLLVRGAKIRQKADGGLLLSTPLGEIEEGRPLVYQSGREIAAKWKVRGDTLSYEIQNYNPALELLIDPGTRLWGTYYGGIPHDEGLSCSTEVGGNVYMAGFTSSASGTVIATSGAHQTTITVNNHAFLAKFNALGVRLWGTYFGGNNSDGGLCCVSDAGNNVFMAGITLSNSLSTSGAHQMLNGGGQDAFLVKFDASGIRQWCTYYGATNAEYGYSCTTDAGGNVYLGGTAQPGTGTVIASAGSHQSVYGGGSSDAFLAKFDPMGLRLWGSYYGGLGQDHCSSLACDSGGNVYMAGGCDASGPIATLGAHQTAFAGVQDAFLIKFSPSGLRLWGTYFGGTGNDYGYFCTADALGNIYLAGASTSTSGISTAGAHQINYQGGPYDAYLVKFDPSGSRLWGTYYGGSGATYAYACAADVSGNIYLAGFTQSASGIATPGAFQTGYAGGADAILIKFNSSGARLEGTYFGGNTSEYGSSCSTDAAGNVYLTGRTYFTGGTPLSTSGSHQPVAGGNYDAFLVKFKNCPVISPTVSVNNPVCIGSTVNFSTTLSGTVQLNFSWTGPNGYISSVPSPSILNAQIINSGNYFLTADDGSDCKALVAVSLTVNPSPTISVNSGSICIGQSFTLSPVGANSYTYLNGGPIVIPNTTGSYSITGSSAAGCISINTAVSSITVHPLPSLYCSASPSLLCSGTNATLQAGGAISYTWSTGSNDSIIVISPVSNSSYTVTGKDGNGCANAAVITVSVDACAGISHFEQPLPTYLLYPNPNKGIFTLRVQNETRVLIRDQLGRLLYQSYFLPGEHQLWLTDFEEGVYSVRLMDLRESQQNLRLIILK